MSGRGKRSDKEEEDEEGEERMVERGEAGKEEETLCINKRRCDDRDSAEMILERKKEENRGKEVEDKSDGKGGFSSNGRRCDVITSVVVDTGVHLSNTASTDV